jgi:hypothetical protein
MSFYQVTGINNRWLKAGWLMKEGVKAVVKG